MIVHLNNSYVTEEDKHKCIQAFETIKLGGDDHILQIQATKEIKEVNILLIGYFILFTEKYPPLQIRLELPFNHQNLQRRHLEHKVKQFGRSRIKTLQKKLLSDSCSGILSFDKSFKSLDEKPF